MTDAEFKDRRKRIQDLVLGTVQRLDNKKMLNYQRYDAMFKMMSDSEFAKWASSMGHELDDTIQIFEMPFEELNMDQIKNAAEFLNIPLEEYIWYRHTGDEKVRTKIRVPVGFVPIKRVQQTLAKKNAYSFSNDEANLKTGQATGDSRVGQITDAESFALTAISAYTIMKEFLGPRADHMVQKREMYEEISKNGFFSLNSLTDDFNKSSTTLNTLNTYMLASGIRSDLLGTSLKTNFTLENDRRK